MFSSFCLSRYAYNVVYLCWSGSLPTKPNRLRSGPRLPGQVISDRTGEVNSTGLEPIWPRWVRPAPTKSLFEVTSSNPAHRACTQCYWPMPMGGIYPYNGASRALETIPWSGRAIITGLISCVTSQCDFV